MRVGYILACFPVLSETFVQREVEETEAQGTEVRVFSLSRPRGDAVHPSARPWLGRTEYLPPSGRRLLARGAAHLRILLASPARWLRGVRAALRCRPRRFLVDLSIWATALRRQRIAHLHTHLGYAGATAAYILSRWSGIPFSVMLHARDIFVPEPFLPAILRDAAFVATSTEDNRRFLLSAYPFLSPDRVHVVRCGVRFQDLPAREEERAGEGPIRILSLGRLVEKKGHDVLLEALGELARDGVAFEARIVGDGHLREALEERLHALGLEGSVRLEGALEEPGVHEALRWADLFELACREASDGDRDGLPVALMEAMGCGIPVVSTDFVGIPELLGGGAGLLVPPGEAGPLAEALGRAARMGQAERAELGRRGRESATRQHDLPEIASRLRELWEGAGAP